MEGYGLGVVSDRFGVVALITVNGATLIEGGRSARIEPDGLAKSRDSFVIGVDLSIRRALVQQRRVTCPHLAFYSFALILCSEPLVHLGFRSYRGYGVRSGADAFCGWHRHPGVPNPPNHEHHC